MTDDALTIIRRNALDRARTLQRFWRDPRCCAALDVAESYSRGQATAEQVAAGVLGAYRAANDPSASSAAVRAACAAGLAATAATAPADIVGPLADSVTIIVDQLNH